MAAELGRCRSTSARTACDAATLLLSQQRPGATEHSVACRRAAVGARSWLAAGPTGGRPPSWRFLAACGRRPGAARSRAALRAPRRCSQAPTRQRDRTNCISTLWHPKNGCCAAERLPQRSLQEISWQPCSTQRATQRAAPHLGHAQLPPGGRCPFARPSPLGRRGRSRPRLLSPVLSTRSRCRQWLSPSQWLSPRHPSRRVSGPPGSEIVDPGPAVAARSWPLRPLRRVDSFMTGPCVHDARSPAV